MQIAADLHLIRPLHPGQFTSDFVYERFLLAAHTIMTLPTLFNHLPRRPATRLVSLFVIICTTLITRVCADWVAEQDYGGVAYFAFADTPRIERYDMATESWLNAIPLAVAPTAMLVDKTGIYTTMGKHTTRFTLVGEATTFSIDTPSVAQSILSWGHYLYITYSEDSRSTLLSVDQDSGAFIQESSYWGPTLDAPTISQSLAILYTTDLQPIKLNADGTVGQPYSYAPVSDVSRIWTYPDGRRLVLNIGGVYDAGDARPIGTLGQPFTTVAFYKEVTPIVLRERTLTAYDQTCLPTGALDIATTNGAAMATLGERIFVFGPATNSNGTTVEAVMATALSPEQPGLPVNPNGLVYTPNAIYQTSGGNLLFLSKTNFSLFRWSRASKSYLATIPLGRSTPLAAYSESLHTLYLGHSDGAIGQLKPDFETSENSFGGNVGHLSQLVAVDNYLLATTSRTTDYLTTTTDHYLFDGNGTTIATRIGAPSIGAFDWNPAGHKLYFIADDPVPGEIYSEGIDENGDWGALRKVPIVNPLASAPRLRLDLDGTSLLLGSGQSYHADSLAPGIRLPHRVVDAVWNTNLLTTIRAIGGGTQVEVWDTSGPTRLGWSQLAGDPLRILLYDGLPWVVTLYVGEPRIYCLDQSLKLLYASPTRPLPPGNLGPGRVASDSVSLTWTDNSDNEDRFIIESRDDSNPVWKGVAATGPDVVSNTIVGLRFNTDYEFRVRSSNSVALSTPTFTLAIHTAPDPRLPRTPTALSILEGGPTFVDLAWMVQGTNLDGLRIERRNEAETNWTRVEISPISTPEYRDTGLEPDTSYRYRALAYNTSGVSDYSPELFIHTTRDTNSPPAFLDQVTSTSTSTQVVLKWIDEAINEDGFIITRASGETGPQVQIGFAPRNATCFTDWDVMPAVVYTYNVLAYNAYGTNSSVTAYTVTPVPDPQFLDIAVSDGTIAYFASDLPPRLERFDLGRGAWISPISLPMVPSALAVDEKAVYVGCRTGVIRVDGETQAQSTFVRLPCRIESLFTRGNFLYVGSPHLNLLSIDKTSSEMLDQGSLVPYEGNLDWDSRYTVSIYNTGLFLGRASDGEGLWGYLHPDGTLNPTDFFTKAGLSWIAAFPDGSKAVDPYGGISFLPSLSDAGYLGDSVDDVAFYKQSVPIVLNGTNLIAYSRTYLELGRFPLPTRASRIFIGGTNVVAFGRDDSISHGLTASVVPLGQLNIPVSVPPPGQYGAKFTPEDAFIGPDEVLYLLCREFQMFFRWDIAGKSQTDSWPLIGEPLHAAYSAASDRIYVGRKSGEIAEIFSDSSEEQPFASGLQDLAALVPVGTNLFVHTVYGSTGTHSILDALGATLSRRWFEPSDATFEWNPFTQRIYFFDQDSPPTRLISEQLDVTGTLGARLSEAIDQDRGLLPPFRVSPDGSKVVFGSGQIYDTASARRVYALPNPLRDGVWRDGSLYTIREIAGQSQIQAWNSNYTLKGFAQCSGTPLRLFALTNGFVALTLDYGQPRVTSLDRDLQIAFRSDINIPPTSVVASNRAFPESTSPGTVVTTLSIIDPNVDDRDRLELVNGGGYFRLDGNSLILTNTVYYNSTTNITVRVQATDPYGETLATSVELGVTAVNHPPDGPIELVSGNPIPENTPAGVVVGPLQVHDPDTGEVIVFSLRDDANGQFLISNNQLVLAKPLDYLATNSYTILVRATDSGGLFVDGSISLDVQPVVPSYPVGEARLQFETEMGTLTNRWLESGFAVVSSLPFTVGRPESEVGDPSDGSSYLKISQPGQIVRLVHRAGDYFGVASLSLAELQPSLAPPTITLVRRRPYGDAITNRIRLDGVGDGVGQLRDFQTVLLRDIDNIYNGRTAMPVYQSLEISGDGAGFALDDIQLYSGDPGNGPSLRIDAFEDVGFAAPTGIFETSTAGHVARFSLLRQGFAINGYYGEIRGRTVNLALGGTANYLEDYFIEGMFADRSLFFEPFTDWIEGKIYPLANPASGGPKTIEIAILDGPDYNVSPQNKAIFTIYNTPFEGWAARRWPGATNDSYLAWDADPTGSGVNNLTAFALGADPHHGYDVPRPSVDYSAGHLHLHLPHSKLAAGAQILLEKSNDLLIWKPVSITPIKTDTSDIAENFQYDIDDEGLPAGYVRWRIVPAAP